MADKIKMACPACKATINAPAEMVGKSAKCPKCGVTVKIGASAEAPKLRAVPIPPQVAVSPAPIAKRIRSQPVEVVDDYDDEEEVRPARRTTKVVIQATPPQGSSSLGIAALVCGVIAILTSWVPLLGVVGVLVAILAIALGGIGIVLSLMRGGRGIGFSIAGGVLAFIAIGVFALVHSVIDSVAQSARTAERTAKQAGAELAKAGIDAPLPPLAGIPEPKAAPAVEMPPAPLAIAFGQWAKIGDVSVKVVAAKTGLVPLKLFDEGTSKDSLLMIDIEIRNDTDKKKISYSTWRGTDFSMERDFATLKDDSDNTYKRVGFSISTKIVGGVDRNESIYPGKSINDRLVFELPIDAAEMLTLDLPSKNIGGADEIVRLAIPSQSIAK